MNKLVRIGGSKSTARVVFGHGLGDTPSGWVDVCQHWHERLPWVEFVLPHAPIQPVTLNNGMKMPSWYDLPTYETLMNLTNEGKSRLDVEAEGIESSCEIYISLLEEADTARTVLAGFSQGGAMALYSGLLSAHTGRPPAGILAMSGYLPAANSLHSKIKDDYASRSADVPGLKLPLLMCHGLRDEMVTIDNAKLTAEFITSNAKLVDSASFQFETFANMGHEACMEEVDIVEAWFRQVLPEQFEAAPQTNASL